MNAAIAKQKTIEIQYDAIKKKIDEYLENKWVYAKVPINMMFVPLDETIELILLDGFDVIITTKEDNEQKKLYYMKFLGKMPWMVKKEE